MAGSAGVGLDVGEVGSAEEVVFDVGLGLGGEEEWCEDEREEGAEDVGGGYWPHYFVCCCIFV